MQVLLDDGRRKDLRKAGIIAFAGQQGLDAAVLSSAPTAHKPEKYNSPEETEAARVRANLPYQFFVSRVAATLNAAASSLPGEAGGDDVAMAFRAALEGLFGNDAVVYYAGL